MQPTFPTQFRLSPPRRGFYLQLLLAWLGVVAAAMLYCWMHSRVSGGVRHDPIVTLRWAAVHWGGWPLLLPLCFALIRWLQRRQSLLLAVAVVAPVAILASALTAFAVDRLWDGDWSLLAAIYHMLPIGGGTYVVFVLIAFWLLNPVALSATNQQIEVDRSTQTLAVSTGTREQRIRADQVRWVQGARNYAELHADQSSYIMRTSLRELEGLLADDGFLRVHRSYLVNRRHIDALQQSKGEAFVKLSDGAELPVGRTYRSRVEAALG